MIRAAVVAVLALLAALVVAPAARAADGLDAVAVVTVRGVAPALVTPSDALAVAVTVRNTGTSPLQTVSVRLRVVGDQLGVRDQVDAWLDGRDPRTGVVAGGDHLLPQALAPGAQRDLTVQVPGERLGLGGRPFGAYGLAVEVRATVDGVRSAVALRRTTFQWQSGVKEYTAQQLAWLVPFTGLPGASPSSLTVQQLASLVGPGSRLRHLLDAASAPGVGWAVDPALLLTLQQAAAASATPVTPATAGPTGTAGPTSPSSATGPTGPAGTAASAGGSVAAARAVVQGYLTDLRAAAAGREVVAMPYADPDVDALAHAHAQDLFTATRTAAVGILQQVLGVPGRTDVAVPAGGHATDDALALWHEAASTVVLDGASRPLTQPLPYTVDARTLLPHGTTGVLSDPELSGLAASLTAADRGSAGATTSRFLAETAAATSELPGTSRRLLVLLPDDLDPDPTAFRALVGATGSVSWLSPVPVGALTVPAVSRLATARLPRHAVLPAGAAHGGLGRRDVAAVRSLRSQLAAVAEVVSTPATLTAQSQRATLELLSAAWRGEHAALVQRQHSIEDQLASSTQGVRVLPSTVNFLTDKGRLQITVSNELDRQVTGVRLQVTGSNPRLLIQQRQSPAESIGPGQRIQVQVPVRALASGEVTLTAQLVAPSGARIGLPEQVSVRVRPTDSWWLTGAGVVVGLVVLLGLVRSLLRPRRRRREALAGQEPS